MLEGTHHALSVSRPHEHADESGWRYSHRKGDAFADLLSELVRWPHVNLDEIRECRTAKPKHKEAYGEYLHNRNIEMKWAKEVFTEFVTVVNCLSEQRFYEEMCVLRASLTDL